MDRKLPAGRGEALPAGDGRPLRTGGARSGARSGAAGFRTRPHRVARGTSRSRSGQCSRACAEQCGSLRRRRAAISGRYWAQTSDLAGVIATVILKMDGFPRVFERFSSCPCDRKAPKRTRVAQKGVPNACTRGVPTTNGTLGSRLSILTGTATCDTKEWSKEGRLSLRRLGMRACSGSCCRGTTLRGTGLCRDVRAVGWILLAHPDAGAMEHSC